MSDPKQAYELTFEQRDGYLYALVRADRMTLNIAMEYLQRVAEKASELNCKRILLERDVPAMMGQASLYHASKHFVDLTKGKRVAVVNRHSNIHTDLGFATLVAGNRGGSHRLFDDLAEAEQWLRE